MEKTLPRIESMLKDCISKLATTAEFEQEHAEQLAKLIFDSMTTGGRVYHSMQHVFDISKDMEDPILILSALFHDVIYYSIDKEFSKEQAKYLEGIISTENQQLTLASTFENPLVETIVQLYGFTPGAELPKSGTNEFLSGLIGVIVLSQWLGKLDLIEIATCIEATIPFRPTDDDGKTPMDRLYDRLKLVCPDQPEDWLVATVRKAAATANFDLCSFSSSDRDFFLDSSWRLLPEFRPALLAEDCPLEQWMMELKDLEGRTKFLSMIVPRIFQSFRQEPSDADMEERQRMTHENFEIFSAYARVRTLQAMVLVDIIEAMGEDPASLPMRSCLATDVPQVPEAPSDSLTDIEKTVRNWLARGRNQCFSWDPAISPLGTYLFDMLGSKGISEAIEVHKNQKPGSHELLKYLPSSVVCTVASRLGAVFTDRAERFAQVPEKLGILAQ